MTLINGSGEGSWSVFAEEVVVDTEPGEATVCGNCAAVLATSSSVHNHFGLSVCGICYEALLKEKKEKVRAAERDGLRDEVERLRALVEEACLFLDDSDKVSGRSKAVQLRHAIADDNTGGGDD